MAGRRGREEGEGGGGLGRKEGKCGRSEKLYTSRKVASSLLSSFGASVGGGGGGRRPNPVGGVIFAAADAVYPELQHRGRRAAVIRLKTGVFFLSFFSRGRKSFFYGKVY